MFSWLKKEGEKTESIDNVVEGLKRIYKTKLLPLELHYQFHDFHSPQLEEPDFDAKPMILLVGQYSTGKTTFIKYLLERDFPGIRIGPEPTTDRFIAVMYDDKEGVIPGNALVVDPKKQFRPLSKFGNAFLNRFQCSTVASPVLRGISIVDTPGILSGEKQRVDRGYDFTGVLEWFAERVDRIILLFDAHKLDISDEFRRSIEALRGHDDKIRIVLNKADMIDHQQLMRVYGALMWSLGKVLQTPEVARVYIGSFWDQPLRYDVNRRLFEDEEQDLFRDMQSLPRNAALRKLNDLIKRARLAKVHAYIVSELRKEMPSMFGKDGKKKELIKNLGQVYDRIQREQQISPGDFPDIKKMQETLANHDFTKFHPLKPKLLEVVDHMLATDIARLMDMIPQEDINVVTEPLIKGSYNIYTTTMGKPKKKATTEEKLAKDRLRKKEKYAEIKNDPEKYKIQKEKDRKKYLLRKEKKKILSIVDMSDRQKREQRRRWRKNSRKYLSKLKEQKKLENILLQNSPPDSETEENQNIAYPAERDPLMEIEETPKAIPNSGKTQGTPSAIRKMRYRSRKVISNLQKEIDKLKKEKDMLRKQLYTERKLQKVNKTIDTIEKKVDQVISDIKADKVEKVKKKLMFNEAINRGVSEKYKNLAKKEKRHFVKSMVDDSKLKKYKVLSKLNFAIKKKLPEKEVQKNKTAIIKRRVQDFLQEDEISQVAPGKNEYVKTGGSKKQKRYLTDNLKNLHMKYCAKWGRISYSVFCKYRPKWVDHPSGKRDTCQCKLHANINLLINSLKRASIIKESTHTDVLKNLCCDIYNRKCLERKCQSCKNKVTRYLEFDNSKNIVFYEWIFEKQAYQGKDGKEKMKRVILKKKKEDSPRNVINKFETLMITFFQHTLNITVQYSVIKQLKENLSDNEVLCHIDFSENYLLKYNEEIQSFHFGGSRQQISLHTGVLYYLDGQSKEKSCKSFCTISKNINHDASAIWAHLEPILKLLQDLVPHLTTIHILSDSPSCQYRNRFIFYMMSKLNEQIPNLKLISWNYSEAGHGKGAPDGIGAVVKRTADNHVKYGGDVATFEDFVQLVQQNIENVELIVIAEEEISKKKFPKDVPTFRGTTKVHQALWSSSLPFDIVFRNLSCFDCRDSYVPCTHGKHLGVLNVALCEQTTAPSTTRQNDDIILESIESLTDETAEVAHEPLVVSLETSSMHIDSPTIFNNIGDLMQFDPIVETLMPCTNTSRVKILSNIPVNYQRFTKHDSNSHGFSSIDQIEFEKFLQRPVPVVLQNLADDVEEITIETNGLNHNTPNSINCHGEANKENEDEIKLKYDVDDWVIVEYKMKKNAQYFIGRIMETKRNTQSYTINFLRKVPGKSVKFGWPVIGDDDVVPESHILLCLEKPVESRRGQFTFSYLPNLNIK